MPRDPTWSGGTGHWDESEPLTPDSAPGDWEGTESEGKMISGEKWRCDPRCIAADVIRNLPSVTSMLIQQMFTGRDSKVNEA